MAKDNVTFEQAFGREKRPENFLQETFDISGKVDTNNPIYRFYEKEVGRYLTNKYGAKTIIDPQGVKWFEVDIKKDMKKLPIEAFGVGAIPLLDDKKERRGRIFRTTKEPLFINNGGKN